MTPQTVIGLDVGRSAVKVVAAYNGIFYKFDFPSAVSAARTIDIGDAAARAEVETVTVGGKSFFTGQTAIDQGSASISMGLSDDWTDDEAYLVLVASAMKRLELRKVPGLDNPYLVIGTPSRLYGSHKDSLARRTLQAVQAQTIKVLPQPMGALSCFTMHSNGAMNKEKFRNAKGVARSWAVIEVGHFTTDFLLTNKGLYIQSAAASCKGIYFAIDDLVRRLAARKINIDHIDAEQVLQDKTVKVFGADVDVSAEANAAIDSIANTIKAAATGVLGEVAASIDGILLAGGGGELILEPIRKMWPTTRLIDDPRMAVAEGYCRFGLGAIARAAMNEKADAGA